MLQQRCHAVSPMRSATMHAVMLFVIGIHA